MKNDIGVDARIVKTKAKLVAVFRRLLSEKSFEERAAIIKENPLCGVVVCRCMDVSEGEIVDAIHRPIGARSLDGLKRRVHQGFGRCQGGFCASKAMEILSRETGIPMEKICKNKSGSEMLSYKM